MLLQHWVTVSNSAWMDVVFIYECTISMPDWNKHLIVCPQPFRFIDISAVFMYKMCEGYPFLYAECKLGQQKPSPSFIVILFLKDFCFHLSLIPRSKSYQGGKFLNQIKGEGLACLPHVYFFTWGKKSSSPYFTVDGKDT